MDERCCCCVLRRLFYLAASVCVHRSILFFASGEFLKCFCVCASLYLSRLLFSLSVLVRFIHSLTHTHGHLGLYSLPGWLAHSIGICMQTHHSPLYGRRTFNSVLFVWGELYSEVLWIGDPVRKGCRRMDWMDIVLYSCECRWWNEYEYDIRNENLRTVLGVKERRSENGTDSVLFYQEPTILLWCGFLWMMVRFFPYLLFPDHYQPTHSIVSPGASSIDFDIWGLGILLLFFCCKTIQRLRKCIFAAICLELKGAVFRPVTGSD